MPDAYDSPWKRAIDAYFQDFLALLFPEAHQGIDWEKDCKSLDTELQKLGPGHRLGGRTVDKLVEVTHQDGKKSLILVHVEVQAQRDSRFEKRMFVYHYRIFDRYNCQVVSLAVLADASRAWRPSGFGYSQWGCRLQLDFPVAKLLDFDWEELSASSNPFAVLVQAHQKTQATRADSPERMRWKLALAKGLYEGGLGKEDIVTLFGFIDQLMALPDGLDKQFRIELTMFEDEKNMPYVTSFERAGIKKGLEQGKRDMARESILEALKVRFGQVPDAMKRRVESISDLADCRTLHQTAIRAASLEAFEQRLDEVVGED
ncbi:MAG: hypothetical protein ACI80V_002129 [Rhodothermales bacterium]|jgi:hypothetical protein